MMRRLLPLFIFLLLPFRLHAELLVTQIVVNEAARGEFFVERDMTGRFFFSVDDIPSLGLLLAPQVLTKIGNVNYFSLEEFPEIASSFDDNRLVLSLNAPTQYFTEAVLDFSRLSHAQVQRPLESSAFVNYRLDFEADSRADGNSSGVSTEVGLRRRNLLILSEQRYEQSAAQSRFTRLMTSATWEWRDELRRVVAGDAVAPAGLLDPSIRIGGVTISRNFDLDPSFIQYPTFDYSGSVTAPAEIDIYQNGMKLRTETLMPGPFQLENLSGNSGYGSIELVLRDQFGRETHLRSPYYLSDQLLKPGLQEYSYSVGLLREGFASTEDRYGSAALLGMHRYGWNKRLTLAYSVQAGEGMIMFAPRLDLMAGTDGVISLSAGRSSGSQGGGGAGLLRYVYNRRPFNTSLEYQVASENWQTLSDTGAGGGFLQQQVRGAIGWGSLWVGSLSFDALQSRYFDGSRRVSQGVTYGRRLFAGASFNLYLRQTRMETEEWSAFTLFTYSPVGPHQSSLRIEAQNHTSNQAIDLQKNVPSGEGYGYLATAGRRRGEGESATYLEASGEEHSRYLTIWGRGYFEQGESGSSQVLSLATAGALTWIAGHFAPSRPVDDSFALVRVGALPGVRVYRNGEEVGRTDREGLVLIPGLNSYYDNRIAIADTDIPIDHHFNEIEQYLSPSARSGSCIVFDVVRSQPITGHLFIKKGSDFLPVEYREIELVDEAGSRLTIPTGQGGEFYFAPRDFSAGREAKKLGCEALSGSADAPSSSRRYHARLLSDSQESAFDLHVPASDALFIDLGQVVVNLEAGLIE